MPLNLLFSRNRSNDSPVLFTDVPVDSSSIMVDVLSVLSPYKRAAGWLFPVRPASPSSYERGKGVLLLFGKTRVSFTDFPAPYGLEFFPRYGIKNYILSVYSGVFDSVGEVGWVNIPGGGWFVNYFPDEFLVRARFGGEGGPVYDFRLGVTQALVFGQGLFFALLDGTYEKWLPYTAGSGGISVQEYEMIESSEGVIFLS